MFDVDLVSFGLDLDLAFTTSRLRIALILASPDLQLHF